MDGWNAIISFCDGLFSGAMLVSGNVPPSPPQLLRLIFPPWLSSAAWHVVKAHEATFVFFVHSLNNDS